MGYKLLLTDDQSALGEAICRALDDYPYTILRPPAATLESADIGPLRQYWNDHHPSVVINTLAFDGRTSRANDHLAQLSVDHRAPTIHLSSYRVFGTAQCPDAEGYFESSEPRPDDDLGRELLALENAFLRNSKTLVLRTPWLARPQGDNLFTRVAHGLVEGGSLEVSDIHRGSLTTVDDVARVVIAMLLQVLCDAQNWGVFHLHTTDVCSEAEFADVVSRLLQKEGISCAAIDVRRNREDPLVPGCALLTGNRCTSNFGVQLRSWKHGLRQVVADWVKQNRNGGGTQNSVPAGVTPDDPRAGA